MKNLIEKIYDEILGTEFDKNPYEFMEDHSFDWPDYDHELETAKYWHKGDKTNQERYREGLESAFFDYLEDVSLSSKTYTELEKEKYVIDEEYDETDIDRLRYEILCKISSIMFEKYKEYFSNLINNENID